MIWRYARYAFAPLLWAPTVDGSTPVKKAKLKAANSSDSATNPFKTLLSTLRFMPRSRVPKIYGRSWQNHEMGKLEPSFPANYTTDRNLKAGHNFPARLLFKIVFSDNTRGHGMLPHPFILLSQTQMIRVKSSRHATLTSTSSCCLWATPFFEKIISGHVRWCSSTLRNDTSSDTSHLFSGDPFWVSTCFMR